VIDVELSDEQAALRDVLEEFAARELRPVGPACDGQGRVPVGLEEKLRGLGVTTPQVDGSETGGMSPLDYLIAAEELACGDPGIAYGALSTGHAALILGLCGSPEQQTAYLPSLADGELGSVLYYEGWGRRAAEIEASAAREPAGWNLNGEKFFVANPATAAVSIMLAVDVEAGDLRAFVFESSPPGYVLGCDDRVTPNSGLRAAHTGAVAIRHLTVPPSAVLPGCGLDLARALGWMRLTVPAVAIGAARAANAYAAAYAQERMAFGRPISAFQGVAFLVADADTAIDAARLSLWSAANELDRITDVAVLDDLVSSTVARVCAAMERVTRDAVQVLGGSGFVKDHPVEYWWRSAMTLAAIDTDPLAVPGIV
jgi:alkylation response protein AidB-like acyl-CoA dehydrogenase